MLKFKLLHERERRGALRSSETGELCSHNSMSPPLMAYVEQ
jgi:hypothetical protein